MKISLIADLDIFLHHLIRNQSSDGGVVGMKELERHSKVHLYKEMKRTPYTNASLVHISQGKKEIKVSRLC
jgi:hypothetical protein